MKKLGILLGGILFGFGIANAQQMPSYKPDQTITISVTFEGSDAARIKWVLMVWNLPKAPDTQPNFSTQLNSGNQNNSRKTGPNTFAVSFKIPHNQASGDYTLAQIQATVDSPAVTLDYENQEIPERKVIINNTETLEKPKIKDVKVGP
jgi:hypothetical protein